MTTRFFALAASLAAVSVAACDGGGVRISSTRTETSDDKAVLRVVRTLQCPQTHRGLTRRSASTEGGGVCTYAGPRGSEVTLHLVRLDGQASERVLRQFETQLSAAMPQAVAQLQGASAETSRAAAAASATAPDRASSGEKAEVRLPGLSVQADGDKASVRIGGFEIKADDGRGAVDIRGGGETGDAVSVQAQQDAAEVRTRAAGDATRATWILSDNRPSAEGWRVVGYEARGPAGGPLVVATVRSKDRHRDAAFEDARSLVALNVGE